MSMQVFPTAPSPTVRHLLLEQASRHGEAAMDHNHLIHMTSAITDVLEKVHFLTP